MIFELLPDEVRDKYKVRIDYVLLHCQNHNCDWHWGKIFTDDNQGLSKRDLICQRCAAYEKATNKYKERDSDKVEKK
jgi:hypothetical protein